MGFKRVISVVTLIAQIAMLFAGAVITSESASAAPLDADSLEGKTVRIVSRASELAMSGSDSVHNEEQQMKQQAITIGDSKQWFGVESAGDGRYRIFDTDSGQVLGLEGGLTDVDTSIRLQNWTGADSQMWLLEPTDGGFFGIRSAADASKLIYPLGDSQTSGSDLVLGGVTIVYYTAQWKFEEVNISDEQSPQGDPLAGKTFRVENRHSEFGFSVSAGSTSDYAPVVQATLQRDARHQWYSFESLGQNEYRIVDRNSGKSLGFADHSAADESEPVVQLQTWTGTDNQKWVLEALSGADAGYYLIRSKLDTSKAIHPVSDSTLTGEKLVVETAYPSFYSMHWKLSEVAYKFANLASGLAMDASGTASADSIPVIQSAFADTAAQKFYIRSLEGTAQYRLVSLDASKALGIESASIQEDAGIRLEAAGDTPNQHWELESVTEFGMVAYRLKNVNSGKYIYPLNNDQGSGASLVQHSLLPGHWTMRWTIEEASPESVAVPVHPISGKTFRIVNKASNLTVSVGGGITAEGAQLYQDSTVWGAKHQTFRFESLGGDIYKVTDLNSGMVVSAETNSSDGTVGIKLQTWDNAEVQKWLLENAGDGYYRLRSHADLSQAIRPFEGSALKNTSLALDTLDEDAMDMVWRLDEVVYKLQNRNSRLMLDTAGGLPDENAAIIQTASSDAASQKFHIQYTDNEKIRILNIYSDKILGIEGNSASVGNGIKLQTWNAGSTQQWTLEDAGSNYYRIKSAALPSLCIYPLDDSSQSGINMVMAAANPYYYTMMWSVVEVDNGMPVELPSPMDKYQGRISRLVNVGSGLHMANNGGIANQQNSVWGEKNQWFGIIPLPGGFFQIEEKTTGKVLGLENNATADGTRIQLQTGNASSTQQWSFEVIDGNTYRIRSKSAPDKIIYPQQGSGENACSNDCGR